MTFADLGLCPALLETLNQAGYKKPTPIQAKAVPQVLRGRDIIGCAQTGTGKTAAFSLPTIQLLLEPKAAPAAGTGRRHRRSSRAIRCLILSPTRELAAQIGESLATYGKGTGLRHAVIYGGVRQGPQVRKIETGVDILVATPGRLLDLVGQGIVDLSSVEILILDEADHMLDMGFINDLKKIVARVPRERQTLMFSATMPKEIRMLASQWLHRPFEVQVTPVASTPELVSQTVFFIERADKARALTKFLQETPHSRALVFSRTKHGADKIVRILARDGIRAMAIHGNKSQATRTSVIREFNSDRPPVLVATDLAARGLDFSHVSHVINYDMPDAAETYVHRIGRTARAGSSGEAISFCMSDERDRLRAIERLTGQPVPVTRFDSNGSSNDSFGAGIQDLHPHEGHSSTNRSNAAADKTPSPRRNRSRRPRAAGNGDNSPRPRSTNNDSSPATGSRRRRFAKTSSSRNKAADRVARS